MIAKQDMTRAQRTLRANIRNFLLVATAAELAKEKQIRERMGDTFGAECVQELIDAE